MATGTISWIDSVRGCCFISPDVPGRDLYVDQCEVDSRSTPLRIGATVEFAIRTGTRGRLVVTNVASKKPANEPSQTSAQIASDVWEGEGGAFR